MSTITDSILMSVKKQLGGLEPTEESPFDSDIVMHINGVFSVLNQLGVGPNEAYSIEDATALWTDFTTDTHILNMVKPYMYAKVRLSFDTPTTGAVKEALEHLVNEYEFRMNVHVDPGEDNV